MTEDWQPERRPGGRQSLARLWGGASGPPAPKVAPPHPVLNSSVIACALYVDGVRQPGVRDFAEAFHQVGRYPNAYVWLGLHEPTPEEFRTVADVFELPEPAVEEATSRTYRPKIEQYDGCTKFVLRTARYVEHAELTEWSEVVETGHILIFTGHRYVITVRHGAPGALSQLRADLEARPELLAQGPWAVAYRICDRLVDTYLDVADAIETDVDALEDSVFARQRSEQIAHIYQLKRELMELRRAVLPLQRPMKVLLEEGPKIPEALSGPFRRVVERLNRCVEQINAYDELLNSILQAGLARVAVDQNSDMRKIAAYAAMAAVQTTIAGIYGMNFEYMPELGWRYGYPAVLAVMALSGFVLYRLFRHSGWL